VCTAGKKGGVTGPFPIKKGISMKNQRNKEKGTQAEKEEKEKGGCHSKKGKTVGRRGKRGRTECDLFNLTSGAWGSAKSPQ